MVAHRLCQLEVSGGVMVSIDMVSIDKSHRFEGVFHLLQAVLIYLSCRSCSLMCNLALRK